MGSEEQKRAHIGAALRGDEVLVQLLSEPSGDSDLAGVITRADRRDGRWIINGAKTWSTWAFAADYGLCLVDRINGNGNERVREMIGRALVHRAVQRQLSEHVFHAVARAKLPPTAG